MFLSYSLDNIESLAAVVVAGLASGGAATARLFGVLAAHPCLAQEKNSGIIPIQRRSLDRKIRPSLLEFQATLGMFGGAAVPICPLLCLVSGELRDLCEQN